MGRERRTGVREAAPDLELTEVIPVRFTLEVTRKIQARARRRGMKPSTWVRMRILDALERKD